jgi:HEAT repeat protein
VSSLFRHIAKASVFLLLFFACTPARENTTPKEILVVLEEALRHENYFVRSAAVKAIGEMGDPAHLSLILPRFKDPISFVRMFSVESVATLHGPDTLKVLLAVGDDPDPMVRVAVVKAIDDLSGTSGKVDSMPVGKLLASFTKDADPTVHLFALASLARHGDNEAFRLLQKSAPSDLYPAIVALGRTKKQEAIPTLTAAVHHTDSMVRMLAAESLGDIPSEKAYSLLTELVTDTDASVRGAAATSIGKTGNSKGIPVLTKSLDDLEPKVQVSAAEGLMRLGEKKLAVYEKALRHSDYGVRHFAIGSLHKTAGKEAMPLLIKALSDDAPRVRIAAVRAIGSIGGKEAIPILRERLKDMDLAVRAYAAGNLGRVLKGVKDPKKNTE